VQHGVPTGRRDLGTSVAVGDWPATGGRDRAAGYAGQTAGATRNERRTAGRHRTLDADFEGNSGRAASAMDDHGDVDPDGGRPARVRCDQAGSSPSSREETVKMRT
jgi:hypothetical protein